MPDIILRCQIRAAPAPEDSPALFVGRLACAAAQGDDLPANDALWPALQPWRWEALTWRMAKADGTFEAAPIVVVQGGGVTDAEADTVVARLGWAAPEPKPGSPAAATAATVVRTAGAGGGPDLVEIRPLVTHGARTWLGALEGLGAGPGSLARALQLASLLTPARDAVQDCLPNRQAFAPAMRISGVSYSPVRWEPVRLPPSVELDEDNREALLVTYAASAAGPDFQALVLPSLAHQNQAPKSYVDAATLNIRLSDADGQTSRFDRDWPSTYMRRISEAFDLTARLADPTIVNTPFAAIAGAPTPAEADVWSTFLKDVFVAVAHDASGPGLMATSERIVPAVRMMAGLIDVQSANETPLAQEIGHAVLSGLALYEWAAEGADWEAMFKDFLAAEVAAGEERGAEPSADLASRGALLSRQDITAALVLRQFRESLAGRAAHGYALPGNTKVRIAQAYVGAGAPGANKGWVTLIPPADVPFQRDFHLEWLVADAANNGDVLTLLLEADPDGPAAGGTAELKFTRAGGALAIALDNVATNLSIAADAAGRFRIKATLVVDSGHAALVLRIGGRDLDLKALGSRPPRIILTTNQALTLSFGPAGAADAIGQTPEDVARGSLFVSSFTERLATLDPNGWLLQGAATLAGAAASGSGTAAANANTPLRERMLGMADAAFGALVDLRLQLPPAPPPPVDRPPFIAAPNDTPRLEHLRDLLKARFATTFANPASKESAMLVPLSSEHMLDLPTPDAHPIVVPYDLGDAVDLNDLLGETTGVAVLVEADGSDFAPNVAMQPQYADTFTLNAARLEFAWGKVADELAMGSRPTPQGGADIRTFAFNARPLVAPLASETVIEDGDDHLYKIEPFASVDPADVWGRTIPQMRFGWRYRFRSFLVGQGGTLPPDLWLNDRSPTHLRRPKFGEAEGFSDPIHYLCRTPIAAPRWDTRAGDVAPSRIPDGARPLAGELPDVPPPVDVLEGAEATFYVSEQDGSGLVSHDTGAKLRVRLYGLRIAAGGEAALVLRNKRLSDLDDIVQVQIRAGAALDLRLDGGGLVLVLPQNASDGGEWHVELSFTIAAQSVAVEAVLLLEAGDEGGAPLPSLEPDQQHVTRAASQDPIIVARVTEPGEAYLALRALVGTVSVSPPRVWAGPYRVVCPETAGQQPEIVALDSRTKEVRLGVRPPATPRATWIRHLMADEPLGGLSPNLKSRIDAAHSPSSGRNVDTSLDHPRVTALFLEVVPLFPRTQTTGQLYEFHLKNQAGDDRKSGVQLILSRGSPRAFTADDVATSVKINGQTATISVAPGRIVEVRVYAGVAASDFDGPQARFAAALARGRRRANSSVLGAPLRLRVESSADAQLITDVVSTLQPPPSVGQKPDQAVFWRGVFGPARGAVFATWKEPQVDGQGRVQSVTARPRLSAPRTRLGARLLRLFAAVSISDQRWSWRGRTGADGAPPEGADALGPWSARLFYGRSDHDAEHEGPIALTPQHIRSAADLTKRPKAPLTRRDLGYAGAPVLWRFAAEFHGRYPAEAGVNRRTLDGPRNDLEPARHARWAHVLVPGALTPAGAVATHPPALRRAPLEVWLPLAEQLRNSSAAAPIMLMFAEPWHARGNLGDRLQVVTLLTRHPDPKPLADGVAGVAWGADRLPELFGDAVFATAPQYQKFWQSWGPDPILTGRGAPFAAVTLGLAGPLGWTQSEGARSDFRRSSFLVEPYTEDTAAAGLFGLRPMFQLAYRRIADPALSQPPPGLLDGQMLWNAGTPSGTHGAPRRRLAWPFMSPQVVGSGFVGQPAGYTGVRLDWSPPALTPGGPPHVFRLDDAKSVGQAPRRLVLSAELADGRVRIRVAISEPLLDQTPPVWRVNHLPPLNIEAPADGRLQFRAEISPTAPIEPLDPDLPPPAVPDTFDVVIWTRRAPNSGSPDPAQQDPIWQGGLLARFKAPAGGGRLIFDLPGGPVELADQATLRPFVASQFSTGVWCQFFGDSSRFRVVQESQAGTSKIVTIDELKVLPIEAERRAYLAGVDESNGLPVGSVLPLPGEEDAVGPNAAPAHRLVAIVTRWITDAEGRRSEAPLFAAPVDLTGPPRASFAFPAGKWPTTGRLRLLTVMATKEAGPFTAKDHEPTADAPFRVMDAILKHQSVRRLETAAPVPQTADDGSPFDLDSADSELEEALLMVVGVSRPLDIV